MAGRAKGGGAAGSAIVGGWKHTHTHIHTSMEKRLKMRDLCLENGGQQHTNVCRLLLTVGRRAQLLCDPGQGRQNLNGAVVKVLHGELRWREGNERRTEKRKS